MAKQQLLDSQGNGTSIIEIPLISSQVEISVGGTFDGATVTFQDNTGLGWADILDAIEGTVLEITAATNEVELISAENTGRKIRGVVTGGGATVSINATVNQGVL